MGVYFQDCGCVWASVDGSYWDTCEEHKEERGDPHKIMHADCEICDKKFKRRAGGMADTLALEASA